MARGAKTAPPALVEAGKATRFGEGNKGGRPKGSRDKLGRAFIEALSADFDEHGEAVIAAVRNERPHEYMKVVASILPKEIEVRHAVDELNDEELQVALEHVRTQLAVVAASAGAGEGEKGRGKPH